MTSRRLMMFVFLLAVGVTMVFFRVDLSWARWFAVGMGALALVASALLVWASSSRA